MPKAYSGDMRERGIAEVESGASRREAAEEFAVSASTASIWVKCFRETGQAAGWQRLAIAASGGVGEPVSRWFPSSIVWVWTGWSPGARPLRSSSTRILVPFVMGSAGQ